MTLSLPRRVLPSRTTPPLLNSPGPAVSSSCSSHPSLNPPPFKAPKLERNDTTVKERNFNTSSAALRRLKEGKTDDQKVIVRKPPVSYKRRYKNVDMKMVELIKNEILDCGQNVEWDDIAGLEFAKETVRRLSSILFSVLTSSRNSGSRPRACCCLVLLVQARPSLGSVLHTK